MELETRQSAFRRFTIVYRSDDKPEVCGLTVSTADLKSQSGPISSKLCIDIHIVVGNPQLHFEIFNLKTKTTFDDEVNNQVPLEEIANSIKGFLEEGMEFDQLRSDTIIIEVQKRGHC
jgi:hypothetical protein